MSLSLLLLTVQITSYPIFSYNCTEFNISFNAVLNDTINLNGIYNVQETNSSILYLSRNINNDIIDLFISSKSLNIILLSINNKSNHLFIKPSKFICADSEKHTEQIPIKELEMNLLSFNFGTDIIQYIENPTNDTNMMITFILFGLIILLICVCSCCLYSQCRNDPDNCCCSNDNNNHNDVSENKNTIHKHHIVNNNPIPTPIENENNNKNYAMNSDSIEQIRNDKDTYTDTIETEQKHKREASIVSVDSVGSSLFGTQDGDHHGVTTPRGDSDDLSQPKPMDRNISYNMTMESNVAIKGSPTADDEKSIFLVTKHTHDSSDSNWSDAYNKVITDQIGEESVVSEASIFTEDTHNRVPNTMDSPYTLPKKIISKNNKNAFRAKTRMTNPISELSEMSHNPFSNASGTASDRNSVSSSAGFVQIQNVIGSYTETQVQFMESEMDGLD